MNDIAKQKYILHQYLETSEQLCCPHELNVGALGDSERVIFL